MRGIALETDTSTPRILVDGVAEERIPVTDRGFLFGDGLFESIAVRGGQVPLWRWHLARLQAGCEALGLLLPEPELLLTETLTVAGQQAAVRLILTRGDVQAPGYAAQPPSTVRRICMAMTLPPTRPGLRAGLLRGHLAPHQAGAGLKHLSRLPQVLLATERAQRGWDEGLVTDGAGQVLEATQGNLLALFGQRWVTPPVGSGVRGVYRQYLLDSGRVAEEPVSVESLDAASALAICNGLRGVEPVIHLDGLGDLDSAPVQRLVEALAG